tara:strand:+ start:142 stop:468 length:327 start_codon:yes stop_codon:yes gene_type:complete
MKVTKTYLNRIIKEEIEKILKESNIQNEELELDIQHCADLLKSGKTSGCRIDPEAYAEEISDAMGVTLQDFERILQGRVTLQPFRNRHKQIDDMFKKSGVFTDQRGLE